MLVKYRPEFGHTHSAAILSLVRDIASFDPEEYVHNSIGYRIAAS